MCSRPPQSTERAPACQCTPYQRLQNWTPHHRMCLHRCHAKGKKFLHPNRWLHSCYKKLTMQFIFFAVTAHCQVTFSLLSTRILSPFLQRPLLSRVLSHRIAHHSCTALHLLFLNFIIFLPLEFYEVTLRTSFNSQYISRSPSWYHQ